MTYRDRRRRLKLPTAYLLRPDTSAIPCGSDEINCRVVGCKSGRLATSAARSIIVRQRDRHLVRVAIGPTRVVVQVLARFVEAGRTRRVAERLER